MPKLKVTGGNLLSGTIEISGAKNSAVALLPAALLCKTKSTIFKVPKIRDIEYLLKILKVLNCEIEKIDKFILPDQVSERAIIKIRKEKETPDTYPRKYDKIKKQVLK